jgi:PKD repeat protein
MDNRTYLQIITVLSFILVFAMIPYLTTADTGFPPLPHLFNGTVTISGDPAPIGTVITAVVPGGGGSAVVYAGTGSGHVYALAVSPNPGSIIAEGAAITFFINDSQAQCYDVSQGTWVDTVPFASFAFTELNLQTDWDVFILPVPGYTQKPTDPDADNLYEDLNGNGRTDFNDVVIFFNKIEWISLQEPRHCFDYNGNGRIDFNDVVRLFSKV